MLHAMESRWRYPPLNCCVSHSTRSLSCPRGNIPSRRITSVTMRTGISRRLTKHGRGMPCPILLLLRQTHAGRRKSPLSNQNPRRSPWATRNSRLRSRLIQERCGAFPRPQRHRQGKRDRVAGSPPPPCRSPRHLEPKTRERSFGRLRRVSPERRDRAMAIPPDRRA